MQLKFPEFTSRSNRPATLTEISELKQRLANKRVKQWTARLGLGWSAGGGEKCFHYKGIDFRPLIFSITLIGCFNGMKYVDQGAAFYKLQHRHLQIKQLKWKAAKLGFQIVGAPAA
ncbi:MAG: hypothetical protein DMG45_25475 [Acidobacteria bacterium]|nr:MAG: hypothetical protein DMG45_25475 [Acidobacteriota bacterium]